MEITRLSTKGQIVLPKSIRTSRAWRPGTEFTVEETDDGVLLRPAVLFPRTDLSHVIGSLPSKQKAKTIAEINNAIPPEVAKRRDRGRY